MENGTGTFILKGKGAYRSTISQVVDPKKIKLIFHHKNKTPIDIKPKQTAAVHHPVNQILYGPPGTGKTYKTVSASVKIVNPEFYKIHKKDREAIKQEYDRLLIKNWSEGEGQIAFCTFHQSFNYEDFVEGIKPEIINEKDTVYAIQKGIFRLVCDRARTSSTKSSDFDAVVTRLKNDSLNNGPITLSTDRGNKFDVNYTGQTTFRIRPHESSAEANTLAKLISENKIQPYILVGIENTERRRDLSGPTEIENDLKYIPNPGGSDNFRGFIKNELFNEISNKYRTNNR